MGQNLTPPCPRIRKSNFRLFFIGHLPKCCVPEEGIEALYGLDATHWIYIHWVILWTWFEAEPTWSHPPLGLPARQKSQKSRFMGFLNDPKTAQLSILRHALYTNHGYGTGNRPQPLHDTPSRRRWCIISRMRQKTHSKAWAGTQRVWEFLHFSIFIIFSNFGDGKSRYQGRLSANASEMVVFR